MSNQRQSTLQSATPVYICRTVNRLFPANHQRFERIDQSWVDDTENRGKRDNDQRCRDRACHVFVGDMNLNNMWSISVPAYLGKRRKSFGLMAHSHTRSRL